MNVIILLSIIAISEVIRLALTHWPLSKKGHFKNKLEATTKMLWDFEFKLFKTKEYREEVRRQYDSCKAKIDILDTQIKAWPKDKSVDERKRLEDDKIRIEVELKKYENEMRQLDIQLHGAKPAMDLPEGFVGVDQEIDQLRNIQNTLKAWIKNL